MTWVISKGSTLNLGCEKAFTLRSTEYKEPQTVITIQDSEVLPVKEPIPINTMVGTRETEEKRTTFGVGKPGDPQFSITSAHSHAVFCDVGSDDESPGPEDVVRCDSEQSCTETDDMEPTGNTYDGLKSGGCTIMGGDVSPSIVASCTTPVGNTQDRLCVMQMCGTVGDTDALEKDADNRQKQEGRSSVAYGFYPQMKAESMCVTEEAQPCLVNGTNPGYQNGVAIKQQEESMGEEDISFTNRGYVSGDTAETLRAGSHGAIPMTTCIGIDRSAYNQGENAKYSPQFTDDMSTTVVARGPNAVMKSFSCDMRNGTTNAETNGSLQSMSSNNINSNNTVSSQSVVRRLTPIECERLQGFPDDWTNIGDWTDTKGKKHKGDADSPRYRALGNSICTPFWQYLANRIREYYPEDETPTMASLFDGIGGFPLVFGRAGFKPVWASEIEEFCIAVTKKHFPEEESEE